MDGIREKIKKYMKKTIEYTDEPIGKIKIIDDFLLTPQNLQLKNNDDGKITINLPKTTLSFFKFYAKKHHTSSNNIIENLLNNYAIQHSHDMN